MVTQAAAGGSRLRVVLAAVVTLVVAGLALVALQLARGGVPVLEGLLPAQRTGLAVFAGAPPALDCGAAAATGGVVVAAPGRRDLAAAARAERDASPEAALLVSATGHRRSAEAVDVVWVDSTGRARLVLSYAERAENWVLVARSGCTG